MSLGMKNGLETSKGYLTYMTAHIHPIWMCFAAGGTLDLEGVEIGLVGGIEREKVGNAEEIW